MRLPSATRAKHSDCIEELDVRQFWLRLGGALAVGCLNFPNVVRAANPLAVENPAPSPTNSNAAPPVAGTATNATNQASGNFRIEYQWRPALDPSRFPLLLVYLSNNSDTPVEWSRVFLAGKEVKTLTDGVMFTQFYPTAQNKTVELQICFSSFPAGPQKLEVETKQGQRVSLEIAPFFIPVRQIRGISFPADYQSLFLTYSSDTEDEAPTRLTINGTDCTPRMLVLEKPKENQLGLVRVALSEPTGSGQPVHVRLQFGEDENPTGNDAMTRTTQNFVRAYRGISIDSFGVKEAAKDLPLRRDLGLDAKPLFRLLEVDPACGDSGVGGFPGKSIPAILAMRKKLIASAPERLCQIYHCTSAANDTYSLYGYGGTDSVAENAYCLNWALHYS